MGEFAYGQVDRSLFQKTNDFVCEKIWRGQHRAVLLTFQHDNVSIGQAGWQGFRGLAEKGWTGTAKHE